MTMMYKSNLKHHNGLYLILCLKKIEDVDVALAIVWNLDHWWSCNKCFPSSTKYSNRTFNF